MDTPISPKDREILRQLASRKCELANSRENEEILKKWTAQAKGLRDTPTVRLLFSNFTDEVIAPFMQCEGETARSLEYSLRYSMVGREYFGDDTPLDARFEVSLKTGVDVFGTARNITRSKGGKGFHINPVADSIEQNFGLFEKGSFYCDPEATQREADIANEVFGDILPAHIVMGNLAGAVTNPLVFLIGLENYYMCLYDEPEAVHRLMDMATSLFERYYDFMEEHHYLLPTNGFSGLQQESFAFTDELPEDKANKTTDVWGFLESQETTAVSPAMYGEFVYPYMDRLVKRYGLLSYGCCERVDALWEDYLSRWTNLRKLSVSPFNNERRVGEYLRGTRVVYYSKPRAELVTNSGPLDEDAVRACFREIAECASGCMLEVAQREVGTVYGDLQRGRRYVELAGETIDRYWKP